MLSSGEIFATLWAIGCIIEALVMMLIWFKATGRKLPMWVPAAIRRVIERDVDRLDYVAGLG